MADDKIQEQTETLRKKIGTKFKMLNVKEKESTRIIERGKIKELERHANETETRVEEIQDAQELMLESDKEIDEVNQLTYKIEGESEKHGQLLEKTSETTKTVTNS